MKKVKQPAQVVIKLLMNCMYGNTIIKPIDTYTIISYSQHDFEKYVSFNYNYIDSVLEVNGRYTLRTLNQLCLIIIIYMQELKY